MVGISQAVDSMKWLASWRARQKSKLFWPMLGALLSLALLSFFYLARRQLSELKLSWFGQELHWQQSEMLVLLALLPLLLIGVGHSLSGLSLLQRLLSFALRAAFFACLILGMSRPLREIPSQKICQTVLLDVSQSVSDRDLSRAVEQLGSLASTLKQSDQLHLLTFAETPLEFRLERDQSGVLIRPKVDALRARHPGEGTNLQLAIDSALAYVGSDCHNRYLIISDGIETRGSALSSASLLAEKGITVISAPLEQADAADVAVLSVEKEGEVRVGEPFKIRVDLSATRPARGQLRLYQGTMINGLDGIKAIEMKEGHTSFTFESVVRVGGAVDFRAEYLPETTDLFAANNQFQISFDVPGPTKVLVVDRRPGQISYFVDALVAQQFDVDVRAASAFPRSASEINQFEFVVLSDLSRDDLSRGGEALVENYVRGGGGLLFAGGEASFGPGGWQNSNLEKILPVRMDAQKEREIPGVAMSLVIDRSGSMTGLPLSMAKEACIATVNVLQQNDLIEVIAFDSRPTSYVPLQPARYRARIEEAVARIQPGGGTEIFNSLDRAYQSLAAVEARRKHIILLTDGNAASDGIYELASTAFSEGITISAIGLGGGVNQNLLTMIAEAGGGRYVESDDPSRLPRIFTRETELISSKATLDDWFPIAVRKDAEFLQGVNMKSAPFLRGYTSTQLAPAPAEEILSSDRGEPILARRVVGLGTSLAWTSDLKARWATDFLRWSQFGKFIAQLVRQHQKSDDTELRPMQVELRGDEVVARVEAFDEQENFLNDLRSTLEIMPHRSTQSPSSGDVASAALRKVEFQAVAPGLYEARFKLHAPGAYALRAVHHRKRAGRSLPAGVSYGSVSLPYPEEYRDLSPKRDTLQRLAELTSGALMVDWTLPEIVNHAPVKIQKGRQDHFILIAIGLFFLDLLVRRLRIFDRGFARARDAG